MLEELVLFPATDQNILEENNKNDGTAWDIAIISRNCKRGNSLHMNLL